MTSGKKIRICVVGLNFGECFIPIYQKHPDVEYVGACDANPQRLEEFKNKHGVQRLHTNFEEVISSPDYDAVHLLTPVTTHGLLTLKVMQSGKHCASAVPMGLNAGELEQIVEIQKKSGLNYMMMETDVYGRNYFYAQELYRNGTIGKIQFLRGCHSQDLEHINPVWRGMPPMWYMTHAVAPLLDILDTQATEVHCYGSGTMRSEFEKNYGNPYPIETAIFSLKDTTVKAEITRTLFETAPYGGEAFDIYGTHGTFVTIGMDRSRGQQPLLLSISPLRETGEKRAQSFQVLNNIPFRPDLLPESLREFASGGHDGSHPHLVHEFIRSIVEERPAYIDARRAASWTIPGICAHESAMKNGEKIAIPCF